MKIDGHDLNFTAKTARKLLGGGDKVKVSVRFRAREITHPEVGRDLFHPPVALRRRGLGIAGPRGRADHGYPQHDDAPGKRDEGTGAVNRHRQGVRQRAMERARGIEPPS